jgi:hypothetical protein
MQFNCECLIESFATIQLRNSFPWVAKPTSDGQYFASDFLQFFASDPVLSEVMELGTFEIRVATSLSKLAQRL